MDKGIVILMFKGVDFILFSLLYIHAEVWHIHNQDFGNRAQSPYSATIPMYGSYILYSGLWVCPTCRK